MIILDYVVDSLHSAGYLLRRSQQVHTDAWSRTVAQVTGPQYAVLVAIEGWPGADQKRVGQLASLDKSTVAGIVARLVEYGWVDRLSDPKDRRRRLLKLGTRGGNELAAVTQSARVVQKQLLSPLPVAEHDVFIDALASVARVEDAGVQRQRTKASALVMARTPGYLIRRAQQWHAACWSEVVRDVTGPQYAVIGATIGAGVATQAQIGAGASLDSSSTGDIVARLIERGWLEQVDNSRDRRSRPVRVTAPAMTAMRLLKAPVTEVQQRVLAPLTAPEQEHFTRWMRLVAGVEPAPADPGPRHSRLAWIAWTTGYGHGAVSDFRDYVTVGVGQVLGRAAGREG